MKEIFKITLNKLDESKLVAFIDRDRGQIDQYNERPAVKFPCALIKVNLPNRKDYSAMMQRIECRITIRIAFEKLIEHSNLTTPQRLQKALEYYDTTEAVERLFQGLNLGNTDPWECISTIDEERADMDVVRLDFRTGYVKLFD